MRPVAIAVTFAALLGLVPVEFAALVLSGLALIVAAFAYGTASAVQRSFRDEIDRQSTSVRALEEAAADVDSMLRHE